MTIQNPRGLTPTLPVYANPVNTTPTSAFGIAYARYLRLRADVFDGSLSSGHSETEDAINAETRALIEVATTPTETIEDYALKLGILQSELAARDAGAPAIMLTASLISDLRNI